MKILIIGKNGQLAWELIRTFSPLGEVYPISFAQFDISKKEDVDHIMRALNPDIAVNASAYTNVDLAETERARAMAVNADGPGFVAWKCKEMRIPLIHYSTDFVFNGRKGAEYTEEDIPDPLNFYGTTKLEGEKRIQDVLDSAIILRTAWLYSLRGNSFVRKVQQWASQKREIKVVDDQIGNPTWARFLAEITGAIVAQAIASGAPLEDWFKVKGGVYHASSCNAVSRYDWACGILNYSLGKENFLAHEILRAKSADFPTPALRPENSSLDCAKLESVFGLKVQPWLMQLQLCLEED